MPYSSEFINQYEGASSPTGTVTGSMTNWYFFRALYQRALSFVDFTLPDGWNKQYFKNVLFGAGFIGIVPTDRFGVVPQICGLEGYGLYLQPTGIIVSQPFVNFRGTRGVDCEIVRLTPDYIGIIDVIQHYADMMAEAYTSVNVSLINSRAGLLALAKNKNAAETLKYVYEKLTAGDPLVVADKVLKQQDDTSEEPIFTYAFDPAKNYITDRLLADLVTIRNDFDREIGIPVLDDKKERRITSEVDYSIAGTGARCDTWAEVLTESIREVKKVFPDLTLDFKLRREVYQNVINAEADANWTV